MSDTEETPSHSGMHDGNKRINQSTKDLRIHVYLKRDIMYMGPVEQDGSSHQVYNSVCVNCRSDVAFSW